MCVRLAQNEYKKIIVGCVTQIDYFVNISVCDALSQFNDNVYKVKILRFHSKNYKN